MAKKKFVSTSDMYKSKARDRRKRGAAASGCTMYALQCLAVIAGAVLLLTAIF